MSGPSLNSVSLIGRLGKDPELRYTNTQKAVVNFTLATSEVTSRDGQKVEKTDWHTVTVWDKAAEACSKFLKKGSLCHVSGRVSYETYEKDGAKVYQTKIIANSVVFLDPAEKKPAAQSQGQSLDVYDDLPF